jgi:hypothetical protein
MHAERYGPVAASASSNWSLTSRARSSPAATGALFGGTAAVLFFVTVIACVALARWLRGHALSQADGLVAADACLIVVAALAAACLVAVKRGSLVLGRVACAFAIVYDNLAITPGTSVDSVAGTVLMVLCLACYALLSTSFAKDALALCLASESEPCPARGACRPSPRC